ncbi:CBY1-interacting BAR domain-containing protein 2-like [Fundulus diaphanus]
MATVFCCLAQVGPAQANNRAEEKLEGQQLNMSNVFSRRDIQKQAIEQILKNAEKNLGELCTILASYTRKTAKLRDKVDLLVATLFDFSHTEDPEFQIGLKNLAEDLALVQDYRHAQVERLETKVVTPLKAYGDIIKNKRTDLTKFTADLNREQKELQKLEKTRLRNPADRQKIVSFPQKLFYLVHKQTLKGLLLFISHVGLLGHLSLASPELYYCCRLYVPSQAEVNAQKASANAQRSIKQIEETITDFQRQKLEDVKKVFREFITVEMLFHTKALEVFSQTYGNMEVMDAEKDMEVYL